MAILVKISMREMSIIINEVLVALESLGQLAHKKLHTTPLLFQKLYTLPPPLGFEFTWWPL